jgi:hypothetical protein
MSKNAVQAEADDQRDREAVPVGWVYLRTFGAADEAELCAALLGAEGIEAQVFGARANVVDWFWQVFNRVDLIVRETDVARAEEVLSQKPVDDLEPAEEPPNAPPPADENGRALVQVAAFETAVAMRDAQTILASEKIDSYTPRLVRRGERPAGVGKRIVLRVTQEHLAAARKLLAEQAKEDEDQLRCPKCGSWSVSSRKGFLTGLAGVVGLGGPVEAECNVCHYRGEESEFSVRG